VCGGATGYWIAEVLVDRTGTRYLASGWRRFCRNHEIEAGHFFVFNYNEITDKTRKEMITRLAKGNTQGFR
jgi:hypothetical protein